ncbi:MAG: PAS domain S-box protein, partial [bacterium]
MLSTIFPSHLLPFEDSLVERRVPVRVLVLGDAHERSDDIAHVLAAEGFEVLHCDSASAALESVAGEPLDAVIVDLALPDLDVFALCRQLKSASRGRTPILQLSSASTQTETWSAALDAGLDGYLAHPFGATELRAAVHALVRFRRHEAERLAQTTATTLLAEALDALADHLVLLGPSGEVLAVNRAWAEFAADNGYAAGGTGLGENYCEVCDRAQGEGADEAHEAAAGIRAVLTGERTSFEQDYACHAPHAERWFRMSVNRVVRPGPVAAIVAHTDRTREQLAARAEASARAKTDEEHAARAAEGNLFRSLTERSLEFVSILDEQGMFRYVSPSVVRSIGYSAEELLGTSPMDLVHPDDRGIMRDTYLALRDGGPDTVAEMTVRLRKKDGRWGVFEGGGQNLLHEPSVRGITSNARDVTERVVAEHARFEVEARFRRFVESTHEGVIAMDAVGRITYSNPRVEQMLGYSGEELEGRTLFSFMPPDDAFDARTRFARLTRGISDGVELRVTTRNGMLVDVLAAESPIMNELGACVGVLVMISDLSERKREEQMMLRALRDADLDRRRLEATLEAIPVGVWLADAEGRLSHANSASRRIWGGEAPLSDRVDDFAGDRGFWPATGAPIAAGDWALDRTLRTGETISGELIEIERVDGTRGFVLNSTAAILDADGAITGGVAINVDVTEHQAAVLERERLLASLQSERTHLAAVFEQAPAFLAVMRGPAHVFERVNPAYRRLVGPRELVGRSVADALPEVGGQGMIHLLDEVRLSGEPFVGRQLPVRLARTSGAPPETRYIDFVYLRLDEPGGNHAIVAHGVDVTEQVLAAEQLRRNERRLRDQFAKLPVPTYLWELCDGEFCLLDLNEAASRALPDGFSPSVGRRHAELFPTQEELHSEMKRCLRENVVVRYTIEPDNRAVQGFRRLELTIGPQQPDRVLVHVVDTTERTQLEAQLRQAQKMDAVGQLAGGVAHDFNNLLTVIGAHSEFLMESLDASDPQYADAVAIQKAGIRAAGLTRQLLAFSRKQILKPQVLDLNVMVEDTRSMLARVLGEDIEIVTSLSSELSSVVADPSQIDQVVMNLAVNARDAMPSGGRLTISTHAVRILQGDRSVRAVVPPGDYVLLSVADTGVGMDEAVRSRLFEPFFTTKAPGKGTGLGLATVYGIVKQSGGYVDVHSTPGRGSTFHVYLPAVRPEERGEQVQEAARASARGVETILLVEDEAAVRAVAKAVLRRQGYVVLEAENGHAALAVSSTFEATIHLVVSDAVMPGMGGAEVVRRLKEQRPAIRTLIMSGYTDDEIVRRGIVSSSVAFVQKP